MFDLTSLMPKAKLALHMNDWLMLGVGVLLTLGTGFFVASEFSLVNLDRTDLESRQ